MVGVHPRCIASEILSLNRSSRAETDFFFSFCCIFSVCHRENAEQYVSDQETKFM